MVNQIYITKVLKESKEPLRLRQIYKRLNEEQPLVGMSNLKRKLKKLSTKGYSPIKREKVLVDSTRGGLRREYLYYLPSVHGGVEGVKKKELHNE